MEPSGDGGLLEEVCFKNVFFFKKRQLEASRKKDALSSKNAEKHRQVNRALKDGKSHNCCVIDTKVQCKDTTTAITENHTAGISTLA